MAEILGHIAPERTLELLMRRRAGGRPTKYVHWDKLRHLDPPDDLTNEEWWLLIKQDREPSLREWPLQDSDGENFRYGVPDAVFRKLHFVDQSCGGEVAMADVVTSDHDAQQRYLVNSMMEEAIRSSQLEGASTSRKRARELLTSGGKPANRGELMIINNYRALEYMRSDIGPTLTPEAVLTLQRILTEGTLDNPDASGRLQVSSDERIAVHDRQTGEVIHTPPPAAQLPDRLTAMCEFANRRYDSSDDEEFMHPVIQAILLHFWLAYDHPFEDGNGRTARALFYWHMKTRGYWLTEYLPVSGILQKAPAKYARSFVYCETDDRDATYFILYQLDVIARAVKQFHKYLDRKTAEIRDVEELLRADTSFSHRQLAVLGDALRDGGNIYTIRSHSRRHRVTEETARQDLLSLVELGLLERRRRGRTFVFRPAPDLGERLRQSGGR